MSIQKVAAFALGVAMFGGMASSAMANANFAPQNGSQMTNSGLTYRILQDAHGAKPSINDEVEIRFISYNAAGEVLEGTLNQVPVILPISEMFTGLQESLMLMPVGATYEFDIPSHLGYSEEGRAGKHAAKYRIELLRINP